MSVTNRTYLNYIKQIALLFCSNDSICAASIESRLKNYLDNNNFELFLASINSKQWYFGNFDLPMIKAPHENVYYTKFNFTNLLSGQSGKVNVKLPGSIYDPGSTDWKKVIEYVNKPYMEFISIVGNKIVFNSNELGGYGIAFVPNQPGTGQTTTTTTTGQTSQGNITVITPAGAASQNPQTGQITATQNFKLSDFDFNKLIVPGLIIGGFLLAKKYKWI